MIRGRDDYVPVDRSLCRIVIQMHEVLTQESETFICPRCVAIPKRESPAQTSRLAVETPSRLRKASVEHHMDLHASTHVSGVKETCQGKHSVGSEVWQAADCFNHRVHAPLRLLRCRLTDVSVVLS